MLIAFDHRYQCPCGTTAHGVYVAQVRINKGNLVASGGLGAYPKACPCGHAWADADLIEVSVIHKDRPKINAARTKRGWPALTNWTTYRRQATLETPA